MAHSVTQRIEVTCKDESRELMEVWPNIIQDITDATKNLNIPDVTKWIEKVLEYNVPEGKKIRALALIDAYKSLVPDDQITEDNIRLAGILAWCVELMQAYILVFDDIQDRSLLRRGQPCWYRYNNIGEGALNDGLIMESALYYIIRKYFKRKACYVNLVKTFQDAIFKTLMGQCLDILSTNFGKKPNLDLFTMVRYDSIAECKAYYTFVLPITVAMYFAGIKDPEMFRQAKTILLEIGRFFQIQDDYLSCFGDSEIRGKDDTDIQEGKCTWFVVVARQRVTPKQRKILEECYGDSDPEKIKRVKQLFTNLDLLDAYLTYEEKIYNLLNVQIQQISCGLPHSLFLNILKKLYRRAS